MDFRADYAEKTLTIFYEYLQLCRKCLQGNNTIPFFTSQYNSENWSKNGDNWYPRIKPLLTFDLF